MNLTYRSLLFVPGMRPDRFVKAASSGADAIIIDLEDAVLPENKDEARAITRDWIGQRERGLIAGVRINSLRTETGRRDADAFILPDIKPDFVMIPKAETGNDIESVREVFGSDMPLIAVIESGGGIEHAFDIARQSDGGVLFGGADYSASLGADLSNWDAMIYPRGAIAAACGAAGVPAYDVPFLDVQDTVGLRESTQRTERFGYSGRACIHPAQIEVVNDVFTPIAAEIENAKAIIFAFENASGGAVLHNGKLVDRPIILAAERTLARANL